MDTESVFDIISIQNVFSENIFYRSALQVILKFFKSTIDIFPTILFSFKKVFILEYFLKAMPNGLQEKCPKIYFMPLWCV